MDILSELNKAMEYIEENICEEIDLDAIAKVTCYSPYHFNKIFCCLASISLSEYIRRRKMTLAAIELQKEGSKVIDIALKYGYDNPDSFARAFSKLHHATPSQAKLKGTVLKSYPKLSFQITIKGELAMDYQIKELKAFDVVGIRRRFKNELMPGEQAIPEFWTELRKNGKLADIMHYSNGLFEEAVGVCTNGDCEGFDYLIAIPTDIKKCQKVWNYFTFRKIPLRCFIL